MRRRLDGVADVSISQSRQTVEVTFVDHTTTFVPAAFRGAVAEAEVEVVSLDLEVCGNVADGHFDWRGAGVATVVVFPGDWPQNGFVCVAGRLNDERSPHELHVASTPLGSE